MMSTSSSASGKTNRQGHGQLRGLNSRHVLLKGSVHEETDVRRCCLGLDKLLHRAVSVSSHVNSTRGYPGLWCPADEPHLEPKRQPHHPIMHGPAVMLRHLSFPHLWITSLLPNAVPFTTGITCQTHPDDMMHSS